LAISFRSGLKALFISYFIDILLQECRITLTTRSIVSSALVGDDSGAIPGRCY